MSVTQLPARDLPSFTGAHAAGSGLRVAFSPGERRLILTLADLLILNVALLTAVIIWNGFAPTPDALAGYAKWFITLSVYWLIVGSVLDLYDLARASSGSAIALNAGLAVGLTVAAYVATPWLTPPVLARSYVFGFAAMSLAGVLGWRLFYARVLAQAGFHRRALLLGAWHGDDVLVEDLRAAGAASRANPYRGTGYQIVGYVATEAPAVAGPIPWLGAPEELACLARGLAVDEIIVTKDLPRLLEPALYEVVLDCQELGLRVTPLSAVYQRLTARFPVQYAQRDPALLFSAEDQPAGRLYAALKRLMDLAASLIGLIALGVAIPFVALANARWAPGPLFYRQERVGRGGQPFPLLKFRSMKPDAEAATGAVWSGDRDDRITPVGRWLRRIRLDELPQVINVLRGEMSLVGPRPERPEFVGELARQMPIYRVRHVAKPGITGWAQIRYRYGNSVEDTRVKLEYDLYYIMHRSLYLDLFIAVKTLPVLLGLRGK
jgi:exopolysaccharide biosynthesis polyprenyl glycosylphosphotransferase